MREGRGGGGGAGWQNRGEEGKGTEASHGAKAQGAGMDLRCETVGRPQERAAAEVLQPQAEAMEALLDRFEDV